MNLTKAERELVRRERHRIALDARDWNSEPFVTCVQLREMSNWRAEMLHNSTVWRQDLNADVLRNTVHPDNADWANRELLTEALLSCESKLGHYVPPLSSTKDSPPCP